MKKVLCLLVVLAILVGMVVCMGAQAFAEEGEKDVAVFAVTDAELTADHISRLAEQCSDMLVLDANGLRDEQESIGYNVEYVEADPLIATDIAYVWPGFAQIIGLGDEMQPVLLVGVGAETSAEEVAAAIAETAPDGTEFTVAVGPMAAAEAVKNQVKVFLATGSDDGAITDLEGTKVIHVGKSDAPVAALFIDGDGSLTRAENMPLPAAADPGVGQAEPQVNESGLGPVITQVPGEEDEPSFEDPTPSPEVAEMPEKQADPIAFTVHFRGNGADAGTDTPAMAAADGQTINLPENAFVRTGFTFTGWYLDLDGQVHQPGEAYLVSSANAQDPDGIAFVAQWQENQKFDVTYSAGEGATGDAIVENYELNASIELKGCPEGWSYEGHTFDGWTAGDGTQHPAGEQYTVSGAVTFTANWKADEVQTVNANVYFDLNGGTNESGFQSPVVLENIGAGASYTLPANPFTAPAGYHFDAWEIDGVRYNENDACTVTGDITVKALWAADEVVVPEATETPADVPVTDQPATVYTVSYAPNAESYSGEMTADSVNAGGNYTLRANEFVVDGMNFTGWLVGSELKNPGDSIPVNDNVVVTAQWTPVAATYTVTYSANGGVGSDVILSGQVENTAIILQANPFDAPEGQQFAGWQVAGGETLAVGTSYTVTGDVTFLAVWQPKTDEDPGATTTDMLTYTQGGTDAPSLSFTNAEIDSVAVDAQILSEDSQYYLSDDGKTITFDNAYLDALSTGTHAVTVNFKADGNGVTYAAESRNLEIRRPDPVATTAPGTTEENTLSQDWNRASQWYHDFDKTVTKLEIYYGVSNGQDVYQEAKVNSDYTITQVSGKSRLTLLPALVNGNWGGVWSNARYAFRVTFSDGTTSNLKLTLTGEAAAANTATPTNAPGTAGGAPVTGDDTPIVMYIIILAVLIVALAVVLIIVMKRRNSGSSGRH